MIKIEGVRAAGQELRPLMRGWGLIHWVACLPVLVLCLALVTVAGAGGAWNPEEDATAGLMATLLLATGALWYLAQWVVQRTMAKAQLSSPSAGQLCDWTFDAEGVGFVMPLAASRYDWAAVKAVREDPDRFVLLITPAINPVLPTRQMTEEAQTALRSLIAEVTASGRLGRGVD